MKHSDLEIVENNPFSNCRLNRKPNSDVLTSIISAYKGGFVLAVNGKWGSGKTTFMRMWEQSLKDSSYKTIYLNAWENDFASEPLVAILGEIKSIITESHKEKFDSVINKVYKFSTTLAPTIVKTVAVLSGLGAVADIAEKLSEAAVKAFNDEISEYDAKKNSLKEIKKELSEFIKSTCGDKPLIFIVDELDRCRPDYAVEILEKIKHFFSVPGVVFVLSIDKEQLGNAIRGCYGSSDIDANEYLRRFIDLEYILPEPSYKDFTRYMYDYYGFAEFFEQHVRRSHTELQFDKDGFLQTVSIYCKKKKFTLRQIEKLFVHIRIVSRVFNERSYAHPEIIFLLVVLKEYNSPLYLDLKTLNTNIQDIATKLDEEFGYFASIIDSGRRYCSFEYTISVFFKLYTEAYNRINSQRISLTEQGLNGKNKLSFKLVYASEERILNLLSFNRNQDDLAITYYTEKIDLLEPLIS